MAIMVVDDCQLRDNVSIRSLRDYALVGEGGRAWWCEEAFEKVEAMPGQRLAGARYGSVWAVDLWDGGIRIGKWGKKWVLVILDRCLPL